MTVTGLWNANTATGTALLKTAVTCRHWATTRVVQDRQTDRQAKTLCMKNSVRCEWTTIHSHLQHPWQAAWHSYLQKQDGRCRCADKRGRLSSRWRRRNNTEEAFCSLGAFYLEGVLKQISTVYLLKILGYSGKRMPLPPTALQLYIFFKNVCLHQVWVTKWGFSFFFTFFFCFRATLACWFLIWCFCILSFQANSEQLCWFQSPGGV